MSYFGNSLSNELENCDGKNSKQIERKRQAVMNRVFGDLPGAKKQFADPAERFSGPQKVR